MAPAEPVLIICHGFPPVFGIGGRRWAKFAKELARRGHPVHVIRSAGPKHGATSLWADDVDHPNIIQHPLPQRYPTVLTKQPVTRFWDKVMYRVWLRLLPLFTKGNCYDRAIFWRKQLLHEAGDLIARHNIRNVIVTGAPFSLLSHAGGLKDHYPSLHLVADFRDPWTWGPYYGQSTMGEERMAFERAQESLVAHTFDKLISPSTGITEHLQKTYGGAADRYVTIPHTIDPDDLSVASQQASDGTFRMIYAGSLYGAEEAETYFDQLLRSFQALRVSHPSALAKTRLDLFITGHGTKVYEQKV
ncbi:MAG: glycosyltransferase, partial [Flavobacteriales bacterium]